MAWHPNTTLPFIHPKDQSLFCLIHIIDQKLFVLFAIVPLRKPRQGIWRALFRVAIFIQSNRLRYSPIVSYTIARSCNTLYSWFIPHSLNHCQRLPWLDLGQCLGLRCGPPLLRATTGAKATLPSEFARPNVVNCSLFFGGGAARPNPLCLVFRIKCIQMWFIWNQGSSYCTKINNSRNEYKSIGNFNTRTFFWLGNKSILIGRERERILILGLATEK